MISIAAINEYFSRHLRSTDWNTLPDEKREAALNMACSDVSGELGELPLTDTDPLHVGAVAEQALYLATTAPAQTTVETVLSESIEGLGSRSYSTRSGNTQIAIRAADFIRRIRRSTGTIRIIN